MAQNDIRFIKGQGLGADLPNEDHFSGMVFLKPYLAGDDAPVLPFVRTKITSLENAIEQGLTEALYPEEYYQIEEFFRIQPASTLYVGFAGVEDSDYTFEEIAELQNYSDGVLRQCAVITYGAFDALNIPIIQGVADSLFDIHKPLSVLYSASFTSELSVLPNLRLLDAPNVSVVIGMDGANKGYALYQSGKTVPAIGAILGALSISTVNESFAWPQKFLMSAKELDTPAFVSGDLYKELDSNLLNTLNDYGYVYLRKHVGLSGSYINENSTCTPLSSDFAYIDRVRTIDKATRKIRTALLPKLNSNITLNDDGTISLESKTDWENVAKNALESMVRDLEISGYSVFINPNQDIGASSKLILNVTLVIRGIARNIEIPIAFGRV